MNSFAVLPTAVIVQSVFNPHFWFFCEFFFNRPRTKYEGRLCFDTSLCVSFAETNCGGRGGVYPIPSLDGGTPSQVWMGGGTHPRSRGVPHSRSGCKVPPTWDGVPPSSTGWGTPHLVWVTPTWTWDGVPPPNQETEQHSEHLLHGGQYASCIHAG